MLKMDDWYSLRRILEQPEFQSLPVCILTGSEDPGDHGNVEQLGASLYTVKPQAFDDLLAEMKRLGEFWLRR